MGLAIDFSAFDRFPVASEVQAAAESMVVKGKAFLALVEKMEQVWSGLSGAYSGPLEEDLLRAVRPRREVAEDVLENLESVKSATATLTSALESITEQADTLRHVTAPAREAELATRQFPGPAGHTRESFERGQLRRELEDERDAILAAWQSAQQDFRSALSGLPEVRIGFTVHHLAGEAVAVTRMEGLVQEYRQSGSVHDGAELYERLGAMSAEQIAQFALENPEVAFLTPPVPGSDEDLQNLPGGAEGRAWWEGLDKDQQTALVAAVPGLVGNTQGVPYRVRDQANRRLLDLAFQDQQLRSEHYGNLESIRASLSAADDVPRQLVSLELQGPEAPLAAVGVGDVDTATDVTTMVYGMGSGTHNMHDEVTNARRLYGAVQEAESMAGDEGSHAVISWVGYDSPNDGFSTEVFRDADAEAGSDRLASHLDGLQQARGHEVDVHVTAHSYGTNTAAQVRGVIATPTTFVRMLHHHGTLPVRDDLPAPSRGLLASSDHGNHDRHDRCRARYH